MHGCSMHDKRRDMNSRQVNSALMYPVPEMANGEICIFVRTAEVVSLSEVAKAGCEIACDEWGMVVETC